MQLPAGLECRPVAGGTSGTGDRIRQEMLAQNCRGMPMFDAHRVHSSAHWADVCHISGSHDRCCFRQLQRPCQPIFCRGMPCSMWHDMGQDTSHSQDSQPRHCWIHHVHSRVFTPCCRPVEVVGFSLKPVNFFGGNPGVDIPPERNAGSKAECCREISIATGNSSSKL